MRKTVTVLASIVLAACATGYHSRGFSGGFSETQLDENVFQVNFSGNGYTSRERAADFTLMRSAELAQKKGFNFFIIADRADHSSNGSYTSPTHTETTASATGYGNTAYGQASTTTTGGQTYIIHKPGLANTIVCFKERPDNINGLVYNATFVFESLSEKYGILPAPQVPPAERAR